VRLGGIDYAWVYASPVQYPANPRLSQIAEKATLLGYSWHQDSDQMQVKVVWQNDGLIADEAVAMRPVSDGSQGAGDWQLCQPSPGDETAVREVGEMVESICRLSVTSVTSGIGGLEFAIRETSERFRPFDFPLARVAFRLEENGDVIHLTKTEMYDAVLERELPPTATRVQLNHANRARLVGYEMQPSSLLPGETLTVTLYWQALQPIELDLLESVKLLDTGNSPVAEVDHTPPTRTKNWWPGEVVSDTVILPVAENVSAPAVLRLDVGLLYLEKMLVLPVFDEAGSEVARSIAQVKLLPPAWPDLEETERVSYVFDEALVLEGTQLEETTIIPGEALAIDLYWASLTPIDEDYAVFIHLLDEAGNLVGQGDGPPVNGRYPTSQWSSGEVILDRHLVTVSKQVRPGRYTLVVGLYRGADGTRLLARSATGGITDAVILGELYVQQ
jgi:hypothetical protein